MACGIEPQHKHGPCACIHTGPSTCCSCTHTQRPTECVVIPVGSWCLQDQATVGLCAPLPPGVKQPVWRCQQLSAAALSTYYTVKQRAWHTVTTVECRSPTVKDSIWHTVIMLESVVVLQNGSETSTQNCCSPQGNIELPLCCYPLTMVQSLLLEYAYVCFKVKMLQTNIYSFYYRFVLLAFLIHSKIKRLLILVRLTVKLPHSLHYKIH